MSTLTLGASPWASSPPPAQRYENPEDDHTAELEKLREQCLAEDEKAVKIWK